MMGSPYKSAVRAALQSLDVILGRWKRRSSAPLLLPFGFHGLLEDEGDAASGLINPHHPVTIAQLRAFVEYALERGCRFIAPSELEHEAASGNYILLTFDDAYAGNRRVLPMLREFGIPAVFFISTHHVRAQECYWWDVLYRERIGRGAGQRRVAREARLLKTFTHDRIATYLREQFGRDALRPRGELDRPFTAGELAEFARDPLVCIGNHTAHHGILTNYPIAAAEREIRECQEELKAICGGEPTMIAFPNGNCSRAVASAAQRCGLRFGITSASGKNRLPVRAGTETALRLSRYLIRTDGTLRRSFDACMSMSSLYAGAKELARIFRGSA